ncbi:MAG: FAD-binding protein, partial [Planctomycetota bacterium]
YIFGKSTNSIICTGAAASRVFQQGAYLGNPEFIQVHPTAIPGIDKLRLISEAVRGEGGRVWTYKDGKKWFFFEEMFPKYGNLVPRDIASRTIYKVVNEMKLGVENQQAVYLDVTHLNPAIWKKLEGVLDIYRKFMGKDPTKEPMLIYPAVHYSMGGLWVDYNHMTNIDCLFAVGECDYQYHGANRLGANSLLSGIYSGFLCGARSIDYLKNKSLPYPPDSVYEDEVKRQQELFKKLINSSGTENPYLLYKEMAQYMGNNCLIVYYDDKLKITLNKLQELSDRYNNIELVDKGNWANQSLLFARQLYDMLIYARAVATAALNRKESRGSLYKPEYPKRDDDNWLKTTIARFVDGKIELSYQKVETPYIKPVERKYT